MSESEQPTKKQKLDFTMQTDLVEAAEGFLKSAQIISYAEACELWVLACDGPGVTNNEFKTLQHILDNFKFTDKARRYLEQLAVKQVTGRSQYKKINKVKYDRSCLDLADHLAKDGKLDLGDAKQLWEDVLDGPGVTECERRTIIYVLDNYTLTDGAKEFLLKNLREKMSLKLMYFNGRGLMEVPRTLLATVNKFAPADYEDARFKNFDEFKAAQGTGELGSLNMNRVPLCVHFGKTIGQGGAINRYIASVHGLMGKTPVEAAQIDNLCENADEIMTAFRKVMPYGNDFDDNKKKEILSKWFSLEKSAGDADSSERALKWHLAHLEACVGDDGYAVGGAPSLADALIYNRLGESCKNLGEAGGPFGTNKAETEKVLADFPKIAKIVATFGSSAGMTKYLAARGDQSF